ncbi:MAG: hypothetical protein JO046_13990, partial [Solirubrobacterales bacterium]|nr:hypothetical protein [Solirubrobacterales bacterium]
MVIVEEPPAVTDAGLRFALAPDGAPVTVRSTVPAEPLTTVVEIVEFPEAPCDTFTLLGEALIEKSFSDFTVSVSCVVCVVVPSVPVTVRVYVPGAAVPVAMSSIEELPAVTDVGLRVALAPDGSPETLRSIVPADPLTTAVEIDEIAASCCERLRLLGSALIEKSLGWTVSGSAAQSLLLPSVLELGSPL